MSDTTPNDGNRKDENWTDNPDNTGEVREPVDSPERTEQPEHVEHPGTDEHHADAGTDANDFTGTGSHTAATSEPTPVETSAETPARTPEPTPADAMTHESYRPAATVAAAGPAAATPAPATTSDYAPREQATDRIPTETAGQQHVYVQAPTPPRTRSNRGFGIGIALLATAVYAVIYALVISVIAAVNSSNLADATTAFSEYVVRPVFYVPVIFFFIAFALLVALVNRAGWWSYVLFGFVVAVVVYLSYLGGALLTQEAWNLTPSEASAFMRTQWLSPGAIASAVIAREVPIWFGAWISRRGRSVTERNAAAKSDYERQLAEGPQVSPQA